MDPKGVRGDDQREYHDQLLARNFDTLRKIDEIKNSRWRKFWAWWRKQREAWAKWWSGKK